MKLWYLSMIYSNLHSTDVLSTLQMTMYIDWFRAPHDVQFNTRNHTLVVQRAGMKERENTHACPPIKRKQDCNALQPGLVRRRHQSLLRNELKME